jgi:tetratricopeptide (TPR) repeat protein
MRSQDGLHRAIDWFRRAIELDSEYAPAYSALANCYGLMPMIAPVASATFMPRAKAAALHALEIDDTLLEARSVLAFVNWHYDWNWKGAERELKRMLKGAPDDAVPRVWYALLLAERGDVGDAIAEARRAQALDPASGGVRANVATVLHFCGRHEEAIDEASNAIAVDAGSLRAHLIRGLALEQRNCGGEASAALETAVAVSRGLNPAALGALGHVCARVGNNGGVDKALRMLDKLPGEVTAFAKALVQIALGNNREALRLLQRAVESREFYLVMLGVDRRLDPIRQRPDFRALVERVGL